MPALLAYIDPGSGSLLIQFLLAGCVGGLAFFHRQIVGLYTWIKSRTLKRNC